MLSMKKVLLPHKHLRYIQSLQKETQTFKMIFLRVKNIDIQNDSISGLCPSIKTFTPEFRQRYDFEFRFGINNHDFYPKIS